VAIVILGALYYAESAQPALREMLRPLYVIVGLVLLFTTWRWFRGRAAHSDRRHADRRHNDRRGTDDDGPNNRAPDVPDTPPV
jgi:hypothetical protein